MLITKRITREWLLMFRYGSRKVYRFKKKKKKILLTFNGTQSVRAASD